MAEPAYRVERVGSRLSDVVPTPEELEATRRLQTETLRLLEGGEPETPTELQGRGMAARLIHDELQERMRGWMRIR